MVNRIEKVIYDEFIMYYFDGKYWIEEEVILQGVKIPPNFSFNGITYWIDRKDTLKAAMLHDYLLLKGYDRKYCDEMFLKQLLEDTNKLRAWTYYRAVRLNSWFKGE